MMHLGQTRIDLIRHQETYCRHANVLKKLNFPMHVVKFTSCVNIGIVVAFGELPLLLLSLVSNFLHANAIVAVVLWRLVGLACRLSKLFLYDYSRGVWSAV